MKNIYVAVLAFSLLLFAGCVEATTNPQDAAAICARNEVKNNLKSPGTADFPWVFNVSLLDGNRYTVQNYVDSQNAFGATVRTNYRCIVTVLDASNYTCESECILN